MKRSSTTEGSLLNLWSFRNIFLLLQKIARRLLLIPSNILKASLAVSKINQFNLSLLSRASRNRCSQRFKVFPLKMFIVYYQKLTKVKGKILWLMSTQLIKSIWQRQSPSGVTLMQEALFKLQAYDFIKKEAPV